MIDLILSLIPGGNITVILTAIAGAAIALWRIVAGIKQSGVNQQKAKEAEARAENLDRIKRAADARPRGELSNDPYNRDR